MPLHTSVKHFCQRVRRDGLRCVPQVVYTRWMTLIRRDVLREEMARRAAEEAAWQAWLPGHLQPESTPFHTEKTLSFLIPAYNTKPEWLRALAESLLAQSCPRWEACICDDASTDPSAREALSGLATRDPRFRVHFSRENCGIAGSTNAALAMATGEIVALCDHDDLLAPDAVRCILEAADAGADFIYTDEDKVSEDGTRFFEPHCKPDFAPDSLRAGNYICHLTAMTRELMQEIGGMRSAYDGSQDHDLALRATEQAVKIVHIPRILYHWRMTEGSFSHQRAEKCARAAAAAVRDQLDRLQLPAQVTSEELRVRIRYEVPAPDVTAITVGPGRMLRTPCPHLRAADWAEAEALARRASTEYLLFLAPDLHPLDRDWLRELLMYAARKDVGCVGSALLDRRRFYRHAGYAVDGASGAFSHHAGQWLYGAPYMLTDRTVRNVTGVSSGLMMIRRELFLALGGFGPYQSDLRGADLGLRCLEAGLVNVYTPHARMVCLGRLPCQGKLPCLTSSVPERDLRIWQERFPQGVQERYYSPLFRRDGSMAVDTGCPPSAR